MAVTVSLQLPNQPAVGNVDFIPLGGDGFKAPRAAYAVRGFATDGDASGGALTLNVLMDIRYTSLIDYMVAGIQQATPADAEVRQLITSNTTATMTEQGDVTAIAATVSGGSISKMFVPPALILPGGTESSVGRFQATNVDGDTYTIDMLIFLYNIRVRELTPYGTLLFARGSR